MARGVREPTTTMVSCVWLSAGAAEVALTEVVPPSPELTVWELIVSELTVSELVESELVESGLIETGEVWANARPGTVVAATSTRWVILGVFMLCLEGSGRSCVVIEGAGAFHASRMQERYRPQYTEICK
ncbi:hypothetical protein HCU01_40450 [Halomonas cupida]|uniref:Uncharacterized protein n=1 Tax=Halomonas cupida TaxID=44933 RepID=A0ABQ0WK27_9GAMM|nr:hypothetical protein HCU01_40450 [Halomonas cupida]